MEAELTNHNGWQIVSEPSDFQALAGEWQQLFASNPRHSPFQSWHWTDAWTRHLAGPHQLRVICHRDEEGDLVFALPLVRAGSAAIGAPPAYFMACGYGLECSDHLGPLSHPSLDIRLAELTAFALDRFVADNSHVCLTSLDGSDNFPKQLVATLSAMNRTVRLTPYQVCPVMQLPESWDRFLAGLGKNFRSQLGRYLRNIERDGNVRFISMAASEAVRFTEELIRLNRLRISEKGRESSLSDSRFRDFMLEAVPTLAGEGLAWMDAVADDDAVFGVALHFVIADRVYYYSGGFNSDHAQLRPGTVLFAHVIKRSIERGYTSYDFLRGNEAYKYRWGSDDSTIWRLDLYPRSLLAGKLVARRDDLARHWRRFARRTRKRFGKT